MKEAARGSDGLYADKSMGDGDNLSVKTAPHPQWIFEPGVSLLVQTSLDVYSLVSCKVSLQKLFVSLNVCSVSKKKGLSCLGCRALLRLLVTPPEVLTTSNSRPHRAHDRGDSSVRSQTV